MNFKVVTMSGIAAGLCLALCACASQSKPMPLARSGQPVIVTTDTQVQGHQLITIGALKEINKNCSAARMATGALQEFPKADAVIGYHEGRGLCHTQITGGGDYQFCDVICEAKVVKFADDRVAP